MNCVGVMLMLFSFKDLDESSSDQLLFCTAVRIKLYTINTDIQEDAFLNIAA